MGGFSCILRMHHDSHRVMKDDGVVWPQLRAKRTCLAWQRVGATLQWTLYFGDRILRRMNWGYCIHPGRDTGS